MQVALTKYWLTIHLGLLSLFSWFWLSRPGEIGRISLLWFSVMALQALAVLPSVRRGETLACARLRVAATARRDPFAYMGLALIVFSAIQWLNSGCEWVYLPDADIWRFSDPPIPWLPYSIDPEPALARLSVLSACVVAGLALRHGIGKSGKRHLLQALSAFSGVASLVMVGQAAVGHETLAAMARQPLAVNPGSFFAFWLVVGMGVFIEALARGQRGVVALYVLAVVGNFLGMIAFAQAVAMVAYGVIFLLVMVYWFFYLNTLASKGVQLKLFLVSVLTVIGVVGAVWFVLPDHLGALKLGNLFNAGAYWDAWAALRELRLSAAVAVWQERPWTGVGVGGFGQLIGKFVEGRQWALIQSDPHYVYNDVLQFLCESGVLGVGALAAAAISLMVPICYRARLAWIVGQEVAHDRRYLLRLSPLVVTGALATTFCFIESLTANPFRLPALLLSWTMVMAALPAFLPTPTVKTAV